MKLYTPATANLMSARILLVDDEPLVRLVVRDLLVTHGYEVHEAADGEEGVRKYLDGGYDLLLVDYHLPALTGPEVLSRIRAEAPGCKAILLSGSGERLAAVPDTQFLFKPFENAELLHLVRNALQSCH